MKLTRILDIYNKAIEDGSSVSTKSEFDYQLKEWKYKNGTLTVEAYINAILDLNLQKSLANDDKLDRLDIAICDIAMRWLMIENENPEEKWNGQLKALYFVPMDCYGTVRFYPFSVGKKDKALIYWDTTKDVGVYAGVNSKLVVIGHDEFEDWFLKK